MKNKINEVRQHGHPKEEQWCPRGSFFTRGGLCPIDCSCRRNSYKLQDPEPSPWDTGFLRRSFQNWMLGICMYCIGRKLLLTSPLFWDTLWLKSFWEKMASKQAWQCLFAFKSIHSSSPRTSWSPWSKAAFKTFKQGQRAMLLMPAVREDLCVDTWDTAATWLLPDFSY